MSEPILSLRCVSKSYGALQVLRKVDLDVFPGEVVALLERMARANPRYPASSPDRVRPPKAR